MGSKRHVFSGLIFFIVLGLRFFCIDCQSYPAIQQQLQIQNIYEQKPLQQELHGLTIPKQKDLFSNENRLQSQELMLKIGNVARIEQLEKKLLFSVWMLSKQESFLSAGDRFNFSKSSAHRVFCEILDVLCSLVGEYVKWPSRSAYPEISRLLEPEASPVVQDSTASSGEQQEYYIDWYYTANKNTEQQEIPQPQLLSDKNSEQKNSPQAQISTTESLQLTPQEQYWHGDVEGKKPRARENCQPSDDTYNQKGIRKPSKIKFSERLKEIIEQPLRTHLLDTNADSLSLSYQEVIRNPQPIKESGKVRQPLTSTIFGKVKNKNQETISTLTSDKVLSEVSSSRIYEKNRIRRISPMSSTSTTAAESSISVLSEEENPDLSSESPDLAYEEIASKESETLKNVTTAGKILKFSSAIQMSPTIKRHQPTQQRFSSTTATTSPSATQPPYYQKRQHTRAAARRTNAFKKPDIISTSESEDSEDLEETQEDFSTFNYSQRSRLKTPSTTTIETDPISKYVEDSGENEFPLQNSVKNNSMIALNDQEQNKTTNQEESTINRHNTLKNYIDDTLPHAVFMDIDLADIDPVNDRTDLLELIENRRSGNRLIKVLEQRNITLEELIEHRKRGSSQLRLTTFVQNRSGVFPDKKVLVDDDMDIVTAFENFPHFNQLNLKSIKPNEIKTGSQVSSYFTSISGIEPTLKEFTDGSGSDPAAPIHNPNSNISPSWKGLELASLTSSGNTKTDTDQPQQTAEQDQSIADVKVPQIEHEFSRAHDLVDLELSGHGFKSSAMNLIQTTQMPSDIRSVIAASVAVILTSAVVFMAIFIVFRWNQRKRRRELDYMESYNAMKSKLPVITTRRTDELATLTTSLEDEGVPSRCRSSDSCQIQPHQISIIIPGGCGYSSATLDTNSVEVHDYLFDALRKSF